MSHSSLITRPYVNVMNSFAGRSRVMIAIGRKDLVQNVPNYQVEAFVRLQIIKALQRYLNHREQILRHYGGAWTPAKEDTLQYLRRRIDTAPRWASHQIPDTVLQLLPALRAVAPGPPSKYYSEDQRFLHHLEEWAMACLDQKASL